MDLPARTHPDLPTRASEPCSACPRRSGYSVPDLSPCGTVHQDNRKGEKFLCRHCGHTADADPVGTQNMLAHTLATFGSVESPELQRDLDQLMKYLTIHFSTLDLGFGVFEEVVFMSFSSLISFLSFLENPEPGTLIAARNKNGTKWQVHPTKPKPLCALLSKW